MSDKKVRVTKLFGGAHPIGLMNPKVGLVTDKGAITSIATDGQTVKTALGSYYPWQLFVTEAVATGVHAYPTGDGSIAYGAGNSVTSGDTFTSTIIKSDGTVQNF